MQTWLSLCCLLWYVLDMPCIDQYHLQVRFQNVENRLPIHTRAFANPKGFPGKGIPSDHRYMRNFIALQPAYQETQCLR